MSRAAAKAGAKDMARSRANLPFRCVSVLFLMVAAVFFGGAAFSPGAVPFISLLNPSGVSAGTSVNSMLAFQDTAPVFQPALPAGGHDVVLRQVDEMMLTERAVSTAV